MGVNQTLKNMFNANGLQEENDDLRKKNRDLRRETKNLKSQISGLNDEINSYHVKNKEYEIEKQHLILKYQELSEKESTISEVVKNYELRFGTIKNNEQTEALVEAFDTDVVFFEKLEKIMGNPFNGDQISAIRYDMDKNLRIIAGAGSGKTQTICAKAAYLAQMENVDESRIMMITFTKNAANELKDRVVSFLGKDSTSITVGTFHSVFSRLFVSAQSKFPYLKKFANPKDLIKDNEKSKVMNGLIQKYKLKLLDDHGEKSLIEKLDYWFSMDLDRTDILRIVQENYDELEPNNEGKKIHERLSQLLEDFDEYKKDKKVKEFNDMLNNFKEAMEHQEVRDYITSKYDYLFIDEFQDTNPVQWNVVKRMCENLKDDHQIKLIVVGDDDQSIYYFRGAEPKYIKTFDQQFPTHTIELMTNYRSKANIVKSANRLIYNNFNDRIEKSMVPHDSSNGEVLVQRLSDPDEEASWIIDTVIRISNGKMFEGSTLSDITESVVLYRSSSQLTALIQMLVRKKIDFVIESNDDFKGIFDLPIFKDFFGKLKELYSSKNDNERSNTKFKLIYKIFMLFYLSNKSSGEFRSSSFSNGTSSGIAEFIIEKAKFVNMEKKDIVQLFDLINLGAENRDADISQLFKLFTKISRVKKELSEGEVSWIIEETEKYKTWNGLEENYNELSKLSKEMKEKLRLYHEKKLNALYLLTIHKSKGLAYKNVFIPSCTEGGLPHQKAIVKSDSDVTQEIIDADPATTFEEERRLMYVAMTRAKENLYLTVPSEMQNRPVVLSRFLKETGI